MSVSLDQSQQVWKSPFDVVVIAASLGGLQALRQALSVLPERFPVPVLVVQHLSAAYPSHLDDLLAPFSTLPIKWAEQGEWMRPRQVYLAPRGCLS